MHQPAEAPAGLQLPPLLPIVSPHVPCLPHPHNLLTNHSPPLLPTFSWELMEAAAGAPQLTGSVLPPSMTGPAMVRALLDEAVAAGLTVVRAW